MYVRQHGFSRFNSSTSRALNDFAGLLQTNSPTAMTAIEYSSKAKEVLNDGELQSVLPREFLYGAASASFQIEGGAHLDNKSSSVWDTWTRTMPFSGEQACDSYHRFRDDVALLKQYGFNSYRFSLSWPRILPHGMLSTLQHIYEDADHPQARPAHR
jgi:hypothetical protein